MSVPCVIYLKIVNDYIIHIPLHTRYTGIIVLRDHNLFVMVCFFAPVENECSALENPAQQIQ